VEIIKERYSRVDGKLIRTVLPPKTILHGKIIQICRFLFELIHRKHYNDMKTIAIYGLRKALVEYRGQRSTVIFYWKIGKYYI